MWARQLTRRRWPGALVVPAVVAGAACTQTSAATDPAELRSLQPAITEVTAAGSTPPETPPATLEATGSSTAAGGDDFVERCIDFVHIRLAQGEARATELWAAAGGTDEGLAGVCAGIAAAPEAPAFAAEMDALGAFLASLGTAPSMPGGSPPPTAP